jgi:hypothetical protein
MRGIILIAVVCNILYLAPAKSEDPSVISCGESAIRLLLVANGLDDSRFVRNSKLEEMTIGEVLSGIQNGGLNYQGIEIKPDAKTESLFNRLKSPIVGHRLVADNIGHFSVIIPVDGGFAIADPLLASIHHLSYEDFCSFEWTGNWLFSSADVAALDRSIVKSLFPLLLAVSIAIGVAWRIRLSRQKSTTTIASTLPTMLLLVLASGCREEAVVNPEPVSLKTESKDIALEFADIRPDFPIEDRSTDTYDFRLINRTSLVIDRSTVNLQMPCCTPFRIVSIAPEKVAFNESFHVKLGLKELILISGWSDQTVGFVCTTGDQSFSLSTLIRLYAPPIQARLTGNLVWNVGDVAVDAFPLKKQFRVEISASPEVVSLEKVNVRSNSDAVRCFVLSEEVNETSPNIKSVAFEAELLQAPYGPISHDIAITYNDSTIGHVTLAGQVIDEWSLGGRGNLSVGKFGDRLIPDRTKLVNAHNEKFTILGCELVNIPFIESSISDEKDGLVTFRMSKVEQREPKDDSPTEVEGQLELKVLTLSGETKTIEFPVQLRIPNVGTE